MVEKNSIKLGEQFTGKSSFGKLSFDSYQNSVAEYGVRSNPIFLFFHKLRMVFKFTGVAEKKVHRDKIEAQVSNN